MAQEESVIPGQVEAIIGESDIGWKGGFCSGVHDFALEVGQEGAAGEDEVADGKGFVEIHVGGVRREAECVDDEGVDAVEG
jgi:hypothetical protein